MEAAAAAWQDKERACQIIFQYVFICDTLRAWFQFKPEKEEDEERGEGNYKSTML